MLQFAPASYFGFESETKSGIEYETEYGTQYENVWIPKTEIQTRIECETESGTESCRFYCFIV